MHPTELIRGIGMFSHNPLNGIGMWYEEQMLFLSLLGMKPVVYAETGSASGGSALLSYFHRKTNNLAGDEICIDPDFSDYFDLNIKRAGADLFKCVGTIDDIQKFATTYELTKGKELKIDVAMIDGFHGYCQILKDYYGLKPYLTDNATIIFHDCSPRLQSDKRPEILDFALKHHDELMADQTENFRCDEAYCYLEHTENLTHIDCHIDCYHPQETGLTGWVRGKTSPHSAIAALRKNLENEDLHK